MPAITVRLSETTRRDLDALALRERRDPREQAALLLEGALTRLGRETNRRRARGESQAPLPPPPNVPTEPAPR
jgi:hypothetical protein